MSEEHMSGEDIPVTGDSYREPWRALGGWFLGPRAENREHFNSLVLDALNWHEDCREGYYPTDPCYFTSDVLNSRAAKSEIKELREQMRIMHTALEDSIPFFSTRYQGHMTWDVTMPSLLGYISGLLWNQNNVDSTASPVTTQFEVEVGMHLCDLMRFPRDDVLPWGHLTGCGSVANVEGMWAARNLKFHPIALKAAVQDREFSEISGGAQTPVYIPSLGKSKSLGECSSWELLNLDIDTVCALTEEVKKMVGDEAAAQVDAALENHSIIQLGFGEFIKKHDVGDHLPVVCSSGTKHYSWPKAGTLLGIGDKNVIPINVDGKARQDLGELKKQLNKCLNKRIPVYMVVAVIGSTEESSIDPLDEILKLRDEYKLKGLNFSVHADSAWGGYINTMTHEPTEKRKRHRRKVAEDFVPVIPLSEYCHRQYEAMKHADTVTIDPHKAGFCPYPAGALLYRNGTMKGFITLAAPEVFHNPDDLNVGVYGLEGSKPGAAACGVLLSHRVIGLDQLGYGRILGQCQLGAKLYYCMWATVALPDDPFICVNFIDFPWDDPIIQKKFENEDAIKEYIRKHILGKSNSELDQDEHAMKFLKIVGPDALINSFTVNVKGNTDVTVVNDLQSLIFNELNVSPGQSKKRVPMFLTTSTLEHKNYGEALDQLKRRVGVPDKTTNGNTDSMAFLRNTNMEPYQSSGEFVVQMGKLFRNNVLNCIGALGHKKYGDPADYFTFVLVNIPRKRNDKIYLDLVPNFSHKQFQYHVILTMKIGEKQLEALIDLRKETNEPIFLRTTESMKLFTFLRTLEADKNNHKMVAVTGKPDSTNLVLSLDDLSVDEVIRFNHFPTEQYAEYPEELQYFLYGDQHNAYMSHVINKSKDFHQVVRLDEIPHSVTNDVLDMGVIITIPAIPGKPKVVNDEIVDPLEQSQYKITYRGVQYVLSESAIKIDARNAKVWFDSKHINA